MSDPEEAVHAFGVTLSAYHHWLFLRSQYRPVDAYDPKSPLATYDVFYCTNCLAYASVLTRDENDKDTHVVEPYEPDCS